MRLTEPQRRILRALVRGQMLKVHRDLDGHKMYQLHPLQGESQRVRGSTVAALVARGLIDSNKKFPAATFWLTALGQPLSRALADEANEQTEAAQDHQAHDD